MKLRFKHQKFQEDAAKATCDIFTGQINSEHRFLADQGADDGIYIYIEVILEVGYPVSEAVQKLKSGIVKDIEYLTSMNVLSTEIVVKGIHIEK